MNKSTKKKHLKKSKSKSKKKVAKYSVQKKKINKSKNKKAVANRLAYEKALADKLAYEKAVANRLAYEKDIADKLAYEKYIADRLAYEKDIADKLAYEKDIADRLAYEKDIADKLAYEKDIADKLAYEKDIADRLAYEKDIADKLAYEKALAEKLAYEKDIADKLAYEKALMEKLAQEKENEKIKRESTNTLYTTQLVTGPILYIKILYRNKIMHFFGDRHILGQRCLKDSIYLHDLVDKTIRANPGKTIDIFTESNYNDFFLEKDNISDNSDYFNLFESFFREKGCFLKYYSDYCSKSYKNARFHGIDLRMILGSQFHNIICKFDFKKFDGTYETFKTTYETIIEKLKELKDLYSEKNMFVLDILKAGLYIGFVLKNSEKQSNKDYAYTFFKNPFSQSARRTQLYYYISTCEGISYPEWFINKRIQKIEDLSLRFHFENYSKEIFNSFKIHKEKVSNCKDFSEYEICELSLSDNTMKLLDLYFLVRIFKRVEKGDLYDNVIGYIGASHILNFIDFFKKLDSAFLFVQFENNPSKKDFGKKQCIEVPVDEQGALSFNKSLPTESVKSLYLPEFIELTEADKDYYYPKKTILLQDVLNKINSQSAFKKFSSHKNKSPVFVKKYNTKKV
jgi:hypothetical protein